MLNIRVDPGNRPQVWLELCARGRMLRNEKARLGQILKSFDRSIKLSGIQNKVH